MTESTVALRLGLCGLLLAGCATMPVVSDRTSHTFFLEREEGVWPSVPHVDRGARPSDQLKIARDQAQQAEEFEWTWSHAIWILVALVLGIAAVILIDWWQGGSMRPSDPWP